MSVSVECDSSVTWASGTWINLNNWGLLKSEEPHLQGYRGQVFEGFQTKAFQNEGKGGGALSLELFFELEREFGAQIGQNRYAFVHPRHERSIDVVIGGHLSLVLP